MTSEEYRLYLIGDNPVLRERKDEMTCMKTGCVAYSKEYGVYLIGDLHQFGDTYVLRAAKAEMWAKPERGPVNLVILKIEEWFDRTGPATYSTLICHPNQCNFDYDGLS